VVLEQGYKIMWKPAAIPDGVYTHLNTPLFNLSGMSIVKYVTAMASRQAIRRRKAERG
jgi:hypothetical protein